MNLGVMLQGMGRTQEALAHLSEAVRLDKRYFDAQANLGTVLDILGLEDQAAEHWRKALEIKDSRDVRLLLAGLLARRGRDQEAAEQYSRIVAKDPNFVEGYFQRGLLLTRMGQLGQAKDDFLRALELKPDYVDAHNNLGVLWSKAGRPDLAVRHFRQALQLNPDNPNANCNLAITLALSGLMRDAAGYYRRAIQAKSNWPEPMISLARILASCSDEGIRDGAEAVRLAEEACRLTNYARPDALDALAAAYAEAGRFSDAVAAAGKAVELAKRMGQNDSAAEIARRLELYSSCRPWRQPTPATNPVVVSALAS
jgi:Flp pilus assembly protein TadD